MPRKPLKVAIATGLEVHGWDDRTFLNKARVLNRPNRLADTTGYVNRDDVVQVYRSVVGDGFYPHNNVWTEIRQGYVYSSWVQPVKNLPQQPLAVRADRRALQQILINLANNAVQFTLQGEVTISLRAGEHGIELAVADTGVGISVEDQARLFQAFTQVGQAHGRKSEGTGLGLHLSNKLAGLMGSRIDVHSEPGRGSRFALVLGNH